MPSPFHYSRIMSPHMVRVFYFAEITPVSMRYTFESQLYTLIKLNGVEASPRETDELAQQP